MPRKPITSKQRFTLYKKDRSKRPPIKSNETIWEFLRGIEKLPTKPSIDNRKRRQHGDA